MPEDAEIHWAPADSYVRAKLLEDGTHPASSGNDRFDAEFLLLGSGASRLAEQLTLAVEDALLRHAEQHPTIRWLRVPELRRALHIHAQPSLQSSFRPGGVPIGTELFTPADAGRALMAVLMLADEIESGLRGVA
jgi:hypothetical protein